MPAPQVCGLAALLHKDAVTDVLLEHAAEEAVRRVGEFRPRELSQVLWGYATLGAWGQADSDLLEVIVYKLLTQHKVRRRC